MAENKVQFNLKNVHYAIITEGTSGISFGTPVAVPGAVSLNLDPQGGITPFYADGIVYYNAVANNGYAGDLEMARFPDQMMQDIWGYSIGSTSKVLTENATVEPKNFALLYQIDGDQNSNYYVLYNCSAARPGVGSSTTTDSKEPQTQTAAISAAPLADGKIMARTTADTPTATKTGWFTTVFQEA